MPQCTDKCYKHCRCLIPPLASLETARSCKTITAVKSTAPGFCFPHFCLNYCFMFLLLTIYHFGILAGIWHFVRRRSLLRKRQKRLKRLFSFPCSILIDTNFVFHVTLWSLYMIFKSWVAMAFVIVYSYFPKKKRWLWSQTAVVWTLIIVAWKVSSGLFLFSISLWIGTDFCFQEI